MKLYCRTEKYRKFSLRKARKALKRRQKRKRIIRAKRRSYQGKDKAQLRKLKDFDTFTHVPAPKNFSFIQNPGEVISFINKLERCLGRRLKTFVILKKVEFVDYGAITVLLSVMFKFKEVRIKFNGDYPDNEIARNLIVDSGFFSSLLSESSKNTDYTIGKENQIITHAQRNVTSELGLPIMESASNTVWGNKKVSKGLQRVFVELMQNTNNHAVREKKGQKYWWLSVNHDKKNKKVSFVFMDHGIGIFSSLNNKQPGNKWYGWSEKLKNSLGFQTDEKILQLLLEGQLHATVTGEKYRGKGLPSVYQVLERNQLSNLYIITNNVYADIANKNYKLMSDVFHGTFFYWELCQNNDKLTWTIK